MRVIAHFLLVLFIFFLCTGKARATHLYGGELFYTQLSGNLYRVSMVLYGDCSGTAFSGLSSSSPEVKVYKGSSTFRTLNLKIMDPSAGTEITPVCFSSLGTTTCNGGTVPGVKKFIYSDTITLPAASNWRFRSTGKMGTAASSGRSTSITNIFSSGSSVMSLEATLNNSSDENSSPVYTTIPTPFFCINTLQEYNPGAVDSNASDSLVYELVDGLEGTTGAVTYRTGYSATAPLATATGSFVFSNSSGQLTFKPNLTQVSLVVYKVSEYRAGVLVGTSMREMNFIVLSSCSNRSPYGNISNVANGTAVDNVSVNICKNDTLLTFDINPVDSDANTITMTAKGLPAGAVLSITDNSTMAPLSSFSWNISSVSPGEYYFFITYQDDGCPISSKQTIAYTITVLGKPTASISTVSGESCIAQSVIDLSPSGGSAPWTLRAYSGGSLLHTLSGSTTVFRDSLASGTYTYRITSAAGCYGEVSHTVTPPPAVLITSLDQTNPLCYGSADGKIAIMAAGGKPPFQYRTDGGTFSTAATLTGLSAGTHTLRVQDANSCFKDTTFTLGQPSSLSILSFSATGLKCNGVAEGTAGISAAGGTAPYQYRIDGGTFKNSGSFSALAAGSHTIRIRDTNGCTKDTVFSLAEPAKIRITSIALTPPSCSGTASGTATINAGGGTTPYQYNLDGSVYGSINAFTALSAGVHIIRIRDSNLCIKDTSFPLNEPSALGIASFSVTSPACQGAATGSVTLSAKGGTTPYQYRIDGGTFGPVASFSSLSAGAHSVSIRDTNLCTKDTSFTITEPAALRINSLLTTMPLCQGTATGSVTVAASGGTGAYQYRIDGGTFAASAILASLAAGTHTITVRDAAFCTQDTTFTLSEPPALRIQDFSVQSPLCKGGATGTLSVTAAGGTAPYFYSTDSSTFTKTAVFSSLAAGKHTVVIRDTNLCTKDTTFTMTEPDSVAAKLQLKKALCSTVGDGAITITGEGGTASYEYALDAGAFTPTATFPSLLKGTYVVRVRDKQHCTRSYTATIEDSIALHAELSFSPVSCYGTSDGVITLTPTNGKPSYTYALGSGSFGPSASFTGLAAGKYTLQVKDAFGCLFTTETTLTQPLPLEAMVSSRLPLCTGKSDGSLEIAGDGGTAPYQYAIDSKGYGASGLFSLLGKGSYVLSVKDARGCTKDTSVNLGEPQTINLSVQVFPPHCYDGTDGSIRLTGSGGTPDYLYAYDGGAAGPDPSFDGLRTGTYTVVITDRNGCSKDSTVFMSQPEQLKIDTIMILHPTCENYTDGRASVSVSGGTGTYRYAIGQGAYTGDSVFSNLKEGGYTISVSDENNCTVSAEISLKGYPKINLDSMSATLPTCFDRSDATLALFVSGGNPPLRYVLGDSRDTLDMAAFRNLKAGTYRVNAIDAKKCSKEFPLSVQQPEPLKVTLSVTHNDCTGKDTSGRLRATVSGGTGPYQYLWLNQNKADSFISGLSNGTYGLLVKDKYGCSDSLTGEISYDNCCTPAIPNAFTPNNDGKNDVLRILYKGDIILKEFSIYNRYGQQVFSSTNINEGWDGRFLGREEELGVYYYFARLICGNQKDHEVTFKGDITLIR